MGDPPRQVSRSSLEQTALIKPYAKSPALTCLSAPNRHALPPPVSCAVSQVEAAQLAAVLDKSLADEAQRKALAHTAQLQDVLVRLVLADTAEEERVRIEETLEARRRTAKQSRVSRKRAAPAVAATAVAAAVGPAIASTFAPTVAPTVAATVAATVTSTVAPALDPTVAPTVAHTVAAPASATEQAATENTAAAVSARA